MLKGELLFSIVICLVALFLFWVTGDFRGRTAQMGPAFWPRFILGCLIILSGIVSVGTIRKIVKEKAWGEEQGMDPRHLGGDDWDHRRSVHEGHVCSSPQGRMAVPQIQPAFLLTGSDTSWISG